MTRPHILIVDYDEFLRTTFSIYPDKCQVDAVAVANGQEALNVLADDSSFALVLMDCRMPGIDGFECTRLIREKEAITGRHIPIIAVTGALEPGVVERCFEAGMDDFVTKPVMLDQFRVMVTMWLGGQASKHGQAARTTE